MTNYHYAFLRLRLASIAKNKNETRTTEEQTGEIVGKQKPGLFSALTLGLVLLIAASALTANNHSVPESAPSALAEHSAGEALID